MPKIVDHDARRQEIADALWTVLNREGMQGVTVRSVAEEMDVSGGSIGHYFESQNALIVFAVNQSVQNVVDRLGAIEDDDLDLAAAEDALQEVIPTTAVRRRQAETWLAMLANVPSDPKVAATLSGINEMIFSRIHNALGVLQLNGKINKRRDAKFEAVRLHAMIDGLSLQTLTNHTAMPATKIRTVIHNHLQELSK